MNKFRRPYSIFHFIIVLSLCTLFLIFQKVQASQVAIVTATKAVVFADIQLTSPIGYIKAGKRILVGEVARKQGTVLPVVVSGKVAYIQVKDLALKSALTDEFVADSGTRFKKEYDKEEPEKEEVLESLLKDNHVLFYGQLYTPGSEWDDLQTQIGNETGKSVIGGSLFIEHRPIKSRFLWGIGTGYYVLSQENIKLNYLALEGKLGWNFFHFNKFLLDLYLGLTFTTGLEVDTPSEVNRNTGVLYGFSIGPQIRIFPESKWGITGRLVYRIYNIKDLREVQLGGGSTYLLENLKGLGFTVGISWKI